MLEAYFFRSYGTYNCKVPKEIRSVRIIGPVRIIGTLEYLTTQETSSKALVIPIP